MQAAWVTPVNKPRIMDYFDAGIGNIETSVIDLSRLIEKILKNQKVTHFSDNDDDKIVSG